MAHIFLPVQYHPGIPLEPCQNLRSFIRGAVVDDHCFQGEASLLIQHGPYAFFQIRGIVVAGDNDADVNAAVQPPGGTLHTAAAAGVLPQRLQIGFHPGAEEIGQGFAPLMDDVFHRLPPSCRYSFSYRRAISSTRKDWAFCRPFFPSVSRSCGSFTRVSTA